MAPRAKGVAVARVAGAVLHQPSIPRRLQTAMHGRNVHTRVECALGASTT